MEIEIIRTPIQTVEISFRYEGIEIPSDLAYELVDLYEADPTGFNRRILIDSTLGDQLQTLGLVVQNSRGSYRCTEKGNEVCMAAIEQYESDLGC